MNLLLEQAVYLVFTPFNIKISLSVMLSRIIWLLLLVFLQKKFIDWAHLITCYLGQCVKLPDVLINTIGVYLKDRICLSNERGGDNCSI